MKSIRKIFIICICLFSAVVLWANSEQIRAQNTKDDLENYRDSGFIDIANTNYASREIYDGLYREANYRLYNGRDLYTATARQGFNFRIDGVFSYMGSYTVRELIDTTGQTVTIAENMPIYSEPFDKNEFYIGTINPGVYQLKRQSLDFYEVVIGGRSSWIYANPGVAHINGTEYALDTEHINGISINKMIPSVGYYIRTGIGMKPKYITIHNTANESWGANARSHAEYLYNGESRKDPTSWHYTVDNTEIWQSLPMNEVGYHAGDGYSMGNTATIGIEIAENADGNYQQAEKNAALLVAHLLKENNLTYDAVRLHKDWSGKHCAHNILDGTKGSMGWAGFKAEVKRNYDNLTSVQSLTVNPTVAKLSIGKSFRITTYFKPSNATSKLFYKTSNAKVAKVSSDGTVTALNKGSAIITVESENGKTARTTVDVISNPSKVSVNPSKAILSVNKGFNIQAFVTPSNTNQNVTYSSSNNKIASVSSNGYVKALAPGNVEIEVKAFNGVYATISLKVVPKIIINPSEALLSVGKEFQSKTIVNPISFTSKVIYSVSDQNVISVTKDGYVTAENQGEAYLYATVNGNTSKSLITVIPRPTSVTINPSSASIRVGNTFKARGYVQPYNANQEVSYTSSDQSVLEVKSDGTVIALKEGVADIIVSSFNGLKSTATVCIYPALSK